MGKFLLGIAAGATGWMFARKHVLRYVAWLFVRVQY